MAWQVQVFMFVASLMLSSMLRKDPRAGAPATLDDLQIPTAEDGKIIPVLFGTREISSYNMVWHGDLVQQAYKQRDNSRVKWMDGVDNIAIGRPITSPQARVVRLQMKQRDRETALGLD